MARKPPKPSDAVTLARPGRTFIQTDRATHEAWAKLMSENNTSARLMHVLCAQMDDGTNAVVVSQRTLAKLMGVTDRTIRTALKPLVDGLWIQVVQIGQTGSVNAYVLNSTVAWTRSRNDLRLSTFHARVIADATDQARGTPVTPVTGKLRTVPLLHSGDELLPSGQGLPPPSQPSLLGLEPSPPIRKGRR